MSFGPDSATTFKIVGDALREVHCALAEYESVLDGEKFGFFEACSRLFVAKIDLVDPIDHQEHLVAFIASQILFVVDRCTVNTAVTKISRLNEKLLLFFEVFTRIGW